MSLPNVSLPNWIEQYRPAIRDHIQRQSMQQASLAAAKQRGLEQAHARAKAFGRKADELSGMFTRVGGMLSPVLADNRVVFKAAAHTIAAADFDCEAKPVPGYPPEHKPRDLMWFYLNWTDHTGTEHKVGEPHPFDERLMAEFLMQQLSAEEKPA